jgi:hypothetical protein
MSNKSYAMKINYLQRAACAQAKIRTIVEIASWEKSADPKQKSSSQTEYELFCLKTRPKIHK